MQKPASFISRDIKYAFITPCIHYLDTFTSLTDQLMAHDNYIKLPPTTPNTFIHSYELINLPFLHAPFTSHIYELSYLQTRLHNEVASFNQVWHGMQNFYQRLQGHLMKYIFQSNKHSYYCSQFDLYLTNNPHLKNSIRLANARLLKKIAILYRALDKSLPTLQEYAHKIYATRLIQQNMQHLLYYSNLLPNIIYNHLFGNGYFMSTPVARISYPTTPAPTTIATPTTTSTAIHISQTLPTTQTFPPTMTVTPLSQINTSSTMTQTTQTTSQPTTIQALTSQSTTH